MTQGGLYFLAESANLLLQKREEGLKIIDSESERPKTCGGGLRSPSYRAMENHIQRKGMNKMNQTQTRSPRKRLLSLILAVILMIGLLPISAFATSASAQAGEDKAATQDSEFLRIFHLDCGRKYFTVSEIEGIIDQLAENHFTHLQLAFGNDGLRFLLDDMSLTVNGKDCSSAAVTSAIKQGNKNLTSGSSGELSQGDMDAIIKYANAKGIQIIPLFNAPGHMYTAVNAMNTLGVGGKYIEVSSPNDARTSNWAVDPTDATAVAFAKALLQKYVTYFAGKGSTMFNIGADESGLSSSNYASYAEMVNGMNAIVKAAGMTTLAYNDGIYNTAYAESQPDVTFDSDIVICYWTAGANSATVEYLLEKGFNLLNNSDNWYYVLGDYLYKIWSSAQWGYNDALNGIKKTPVTQMKDGKDYANSKQLLGSILCVWCDAPGETYESVKVYNLIKAMAENNPDYFTGKVKLSASDDATGVSVAVTGTKGQKATVEVKKITSDFTFDTEAHVSYNVTPAVDGKAYTGEGTVTLPVPEGWATEDSRIHAYIIDNGAVKLISGTLSGGKYTFQVPHFSEMGLVQLAKGAGSTENVTVAVGRTSKAYDLTGDNLPNDGTYPLGDVASYTVTTAASGWKAESEAATTIVTGKQYVIGNGSQYLTLNDGTLGTIDDSSKAEVWTITKSGSGYTIKSGSYSYYLSYSVDFWNGYSLSASTSSTTWSWSANDGFYFTNYRKYYLTYSDGWTVSRYANANGQPYTATEVPGGKTVTFKGLNPGSTSVTLGDTTYSVTVVEKQNVEIPITIIDYRADGLLFDFQVGGKTYDYGLVHSHNNDGDVSSVNGGTLPGESYGTRIDGTTLENSGYDASDSYSGNYYLWGNKWSRSGMVESELGSNGMPVYTNATVARVAQELAAGNYNSDEMAGVVNDNDVIYNTFIASDTASRKVTGTDATKMSYAFSARKTWDNITNAYDLAWYLLNTLYQADTNMTTVTGTDGADHAVPIYGMKVDAYDRLILTENNGVYSFDAANKKSNYDTESRSIYEDDTASSLQFYPIDGLGYDAILGDTTDKTNTSGNGVRPEHPNGSYTLRGEAQFVYQEDLYFEFSGDDDVYMYINGVLALDLGGAHGICTKRVNLKDVAAKCHLTPGEVATFTFFYMERNSDASNFKIETNMELLQRDINVEKKAYDTSYANEYASGTAVINGTTVAYDLIVTNKSNSPMTQIKLTDTDSLGGNVTIGSGVDVSPDVTPGASNDKGNVALGQGNGYVLFITDSTGTEVANTRKSLSSLQALSDEIAGLTLPAGQSLHVRFLTAKTEINESKILDYINTVEVSATVGGQALSDKASHELYSYNAKDTGRTYVVDFGLPLKIEGIFDTGAASNIGEVSLSPKNVQKYGTVTIAPSGFNTTLTYTLKANTTINEPETITLDVVYKIGNSNIKLEKTLTIIPASNVYYEDSLAAFTDGKGAALGADWKLVDNKGNENATEDTTTTQALEQLGSSGIYGKDDAYNSSSMLSMGTAHKVTVTANMAAKWSKDDTTSAWPTAQFTFKGTGFDIISLTNNKSGTIFVDVTNTATGKQYNYVVNNYYGYTYQNDEWVVNKDTSDTLYQIPVMKVDGLGYGEYNVVIKVAYNKFFDTAEAKEYSFWLDAVRIYDPMGEYADYTQDNEGYPQYIKLRDTLVDGTAKPDGTDKTVFIDGGSTADIKTTYANYGPNNEVYLMKGQAITFKIPANDKIASIQIGAKAPKGTANLNVNEKEIVSGGLSTATEMYYQIATVGGQFTITNTGDGILSLTNLKITYSAKSSVSLGTLNTQEQENAVSLVRALFTAPVATFSPETFEADWGRAVRAGKRATLTVKTSADVESITVDGQSITSYTTRTQRTGWGWWSPKVTYHVFTYTITAPAQTTDYAVCAVNAEGTASEAVTATLTVKLTTWWNWWF
ncbi:MAG TPA: hypothetical protein DIU32_07740 [Oscillibacter sp.]|nr:hypothetical protein [Oscillibacter sp.]